MSVAVIGAGISGCVAARELLKANYKVHLIEKSSSIGGRLATRRVAVHAGNQLKADTGAQFITARTQVFKDEIIQPGIDGGYIHVWNYGGFTDTNLAKTQTGHSSEKAHDGHPRYASTLGLNGAIKQTFRDLLKNSNCTFLPNVRVNSIELLNQNSQFQLTLDNNDKITCHHVFITLPLPQAVPLIRNVVLQEDTKSKFTCNVKEVSELVERKNYDPCLCLIIILPSFLAKTLISNSSGAKKIAGDPIVQWIASNNSKGMSTNESQEFDAITIHCNSEFSKDNYDLTDDEILDKIMSTSVLNMYRDNVKSWSVKKWKYAVPLLPDQSNGNFLEDAAYVSFYSKSSSLHLVGDSYTKQPRVEASFLSALMLLLWMLIVPSHRHEMGNLSHVDASTWNGEHWKDSVTGDSKSPFGTTRYTLLGPDDGPKLVFIHGITASACVFPDFIQGLADAGFRVLVYDLFGRGFSAAPAAQYNDGLYVAQLFFLTDDLGWTKFHLCGLSLGGGIATSFSSQYPDKILSLSLIAPAGLMTRLPVIAYVLQTPLIGPVIWYALGRKVLEKISKSNFIKNANDAVIRAKVMTVDHIRIHPGFPRAYYSTVQHFPLCDMDIQYSKLEKLLHKRVGVIWGSQDTVVPFSLLPKFKSLVPSAKVYIFDNEGHSICVENPSVCVESIKETTKIKLS